MMTYLFYLRDFSRDTFVAGSRRKQPAPSRLLLFILVLFFLTESRAKVPLSLFQKL